MSEKYVARIGDTVQGTCYAHKNPVSFTGTFTTGSSTCTADGIGIVRIGDTGTTSCGHTIQATTGSSLSLVDGLGVHRVGDTGIVVQGGDYTVVSGSSVVKAA